jgi:hypothetical protein
MESQDRLRAGSKHTLYKASPSTPMGTPENRRAAMPRIDSQSCACGGKCPRCQGKSRSLVIGDDDSRPTKTLEFPIPTMSDINELADSSHHCPPSLVSSSLPSGTLTPAIHGNRFDAPFDMDATFSAPIPCSGACGEYRQYVWGHFSQEGTDLTHALCGDNLSRLVPHEDCANVGGTIYKYGYHSIPFGNSTFSNPDQSTGFTYHGHDAPGFNNVSSFRSGTPLAIDLTFYGAWVDACDSARVLGSSTWHVRGSHTVA